MPIIVLDNFCPQIDRVRASAIQSGFGTWAPPKGEVGSSIYEGMNFWGDHALMVHSLAIALGRPVFPNSMFFRVTNETTEPAYVHSDREAGDFTCVAYLSNHDQPSGTGFYRHRETGMREMPGFAELAKQPKFFDKLKTEMVSGSEEHWELLDFVRGIYNRAVVFDAPLFHARNPKNGIGTTPETGRIVWVCHYFLNLSP